MVTPVSHASISEASSTRYAALAPAPSATSTMRLESRARADDEHEVGPGRDLLDGSGGSAWRSRCRSAAEEVVAALERAHVSIVSSTDSVVSEMTLSGSRTVTFSTSSGPSTSVMWSGASPLVPMTSSCPS